jgi:hypothetical protein
MKTSRKSYRITGLTVMGPGVNKISKVFWFLKTWNSEVTYFFNKAS